MNITGNTILIIGGNFRIAQGLRKPFTVRAVVTLLWSNGQTKSKLPS